VFIPDLAPTLERGLYGLDLLENIRPAPLNRTIIVSRVPMLKHFHKSVCDQVNMFKNIKLVPGCGACLKIFI
jgi:hypothetical protein